MNTEGLKQFISEIRIIDSPTERAMYSHDIGDIPSIMSRALFNILPDVVVQPKNINEIRRVLAFANEQKIPVIPRGTASWGFGGVVPTSGGMVIDLSPFRNIISIDTAQKTATVEAGARWSDIDIAVKRHGLCLMTYPSSKFSTVGGWISTGGYGINSFKYGHLSKQIVSMRIVTADGEMRQLSPSDHDFAYFISTEGVFGIVVEVTLRLRDIPQGSFPHLLYFPSDREAFAFIDRFIGSLPDRKYNPNVIRFLDENHLVDTNAILRSDIFKKSAGVLVELDNFEEDVSLTKYIFENNTEEAPRYVASYLWNERLFGMKAKRLGPTILASEIIMPISSAAVYIEKAKKIGSHFGVEISIDSYIIDSQKALIMANFLCDSRKKKYYIDLPLVSILTHTAVSLGAEPYGLGLWNAAFIKHRYDREKRRDMRAFKTKVDPHNILNPGKLFSSGSKGIAGILFHPVVFGVLMRIATPMSPVIGKIATVSLGKDKKIDSLDYELSLHACAKCGNCIAVCPAYLVTGNEALTAKGKIALARKLLNGQTVTEEEAGNAFLCMHCKACEEVCQTNLELMNLWDALEKRIENQFGRPEARITKFLKKVDASKEYWNMIEQNSMPSLHARSRSITDK
ncbi:MAG: FAD-binding protein [Dehalococcoidales bacterium]|nr:FAD-binding protein [Dehalococcoidales bacterium]